MIFPWESLKFIRLQLPINESRETLFLLYKKRILFAVISAIVEHSLYSCSTYFAIQQNLENSEKLKLEAEKTRCFCTCIVNSVKEDL